MFLADRLTLDAPRRTKDGYLAVRAKAARTGVYDYAGSEVDPQNEHGLRDKAVVKVLRDEQTVFDKAAVQSFIGKPITNDHPREAVTAANWRDHARGTIMGAIREGEYVAFDLLLTDKAAIDAVDGGKRELSNGYGAELEFGSFTAPCGTVCDARQTKITGGNHVALVDRGRAGPNCAIKDFALCDANPAAVAGLSDSVENAVSWLEKAIALHKKHMNGTAPTTGKDGEKSQMLMMQQMENALEELQPDVSGKPRNRMSGMKMDSNPKGNAVKKIVLDGLQVDLSDADAVSAAIDKLQGQVTAANEAKGKALADVATLTTDKATLDAKVTTLEKQVADAKLTPAALRDAAKAYAAVCDKAKALGVTVTDEMDEPAAMKAVVSAKIGDAAKEWNDAQIAASFATLTADVKAPATVHNINPAANVNDTAADVRNAARAAQYA